MHNAGVALLAENRRFELRSADAENVTHGRLDAVELRDERPGVGGLAERKPVAAIDHEVVVGGAPVVGRIFEDGAQDGHRAACADVVAVVHLLQHRLALLQRSRSRAMQGRVRRRGGDIGGVVGV